ncbi:MAG: type II secretion system minor pseudopilin GspH [Gammaproteobacteria bacterium]|nr:type II secretion system minor pseudopilin GspH [Gammaproteobacteria bacterium]
MNAQRGFTLLELLVVMVLMAVLSAAAMSTINYAFDEDTAERHSARLAQLITLAAEEALLTGKEMGLRIEDRRYSFYRLDERAGQWVPLDDQKLFVPRSLPDHLALEVSVEGNVTDLSGRSADDDTAADPGIDADPETPTATGKDGAPAATSDPEQAPQVLFFSSGQTTPFTLRVRDQRDDQEWSLDVDLLGRVERQQQDEF